MLETDAHVIGNFSQMGMSPPWQLIEELKKQYEVVQVSPTDLAAPPSRARPEAGYDVLLAIQPSAMGPQEMDGFVAAVRCGPADGDLRRPLLLPLTGVRGVPGTYQPRMPQQNPMMGFDGRENQEKGDIRALWRLLGIDFSDGGEGDEFNPMAGPPPSRGTEKVVWQRYNPFPKLGDIIEPELVFIDQGCGAKEPFCEKRLRSARNCRTCFSPARLHRGYAGGRQAVDRQMAQPPVRQATQPGDADAGQRIDKRRDAGQRGKVRAKCPALGGGPGRTQPGLQRRRGREDHPARPDRATTTR